MPWNYVQTGPSAPGQAGALELEDRSWQGYVEFQVPQSVQGSGKWRVDQAGNVTASGVVTQNGGTSTAGTATVTTPTFVSTTARQLSTTQDSMLYINITTAASLAVAIGADNTTANTIQSAESSALGVITLRIPAGWWVKLTGTMADLAITAVTC
jgi:hypothetical protein